MQMWEHSSLSMDGEDAIIVDWGTAGAVEKQYVLYDLYAVFVLEGLINHNSIQMKSLSKTKNHFASTCPYLLS